MSALKTSLLLSFFIIVSGISYAQSIKLSGKITDIQGNPLPEANVKIKPAQAKSDANGQYSLAVPAIGQYEVEVILMGFEKINQSITVQGDNQALDFKLLPADYQIQEVMISTQKRVQNKIDVPITIDVLGGQKLNKLNLQELNELSAFTPGVQLEIQSANNPAFAIRGITSDNLDPRSQPRVSLSMDAVSISRPSLAVAELYDMERVEIAKGPQGTLLGRSAQIGAINLIRKKPVKDQLVDFKAQYGNYNKRLFNGMYNYGSETSAFANRFAFAYNAQDGFVKNLSGGRLNGKNTLAFRNSSRFFLKNDGTMDLVLSYQRDDAPGTSFKSGVWRPKNGDLKPSTFADLDRGKDLGIERDVYSATFLQDHKLSDTWTLSTVTGFNRYFARENFDADGTAAPVLNPTDRSYGNQFSQELRLNYDKGSKFNGFVGLNYFFENSKENVNLRVNEQYLFPAFVSGQISDQIIQQLPNVLKMIPAAEKLNIAQYGGLINPAVNRLFPSQSPLLLNGVPQPTTTLPNLYKIVAQELSSFNIMPFIPEQYRGIASWMIPNGIISPEVLEGLVGTYAPEQAELLNSISSAPLNPNHNESYSMIGKTHSFDIFMDGTYSLTEKLKLTAGIRGTYERITGAYQSQETTDPSIIAQFRNKNNNLLSPVANEWITEFKDYVSYVGRLAMNYKFHPSHNVYATVSKGRRPPVLYVRPGASKNLKPEIVWNYELGVKGVHNNILSYSLAGYYYDWSSFQTTRLVPVDGVIGLQQVAEDAGKARSFGVESSVEYQIMKFMNIYGNYAFVDAKFNDKDSDGNTQLYSGNTFRMTPKHSFTVGMDITQMIDEKKQIYFRPNYSYKSKVYFEDDNREYLSQKGYGIMNATVGIKFFTTAKRTMDISLFGKNILDQKFIMDAGNSGDNIGLPTFVAGARGTYGVSLGVSL